MENITQQISECCFDFNEKWGDCKLDLVRLLEVNPNLYYDLIKLREEK